MPIPKKTRLDHDHAEALEQTHRALKIFMGSIAHDLCSQLATVHMIGSNIKKFLPKLIDAYHLAQQANLPNLDTLHPAQFDTLSKTARVLEKITTDINIFVAENFKALHHLDTQNITAQNLIVCSMERCIHNALDSYRLNSSGYESVHWDRNHSFMFLGHPILFYRVFCTLMDHALAEMSLYKNGKIFISSEEMDQNHNILCFRYTMPTISADQINTHLSHTFFTDTQTSAKSFKFCQQAMRCFGGDIHFKTDNVDGIELNLIFPKLP